MKGKLYGIGVGPGDPELMTLKAKRLIEECDIVAVPVKKEGEESVALNIARGAASVPEEKVRRILFTMNKDKAKREECRQAAAEAIMEYLDAGQSVAMPVLGDVGIYSTYSYVHKKLIQAGYEVQMISGIALIAGLPALDNLFFWANTNLSPAGAIHGFMWGCIGYTAVFTVVLYCLTIRMLHRHLNLE